MARAESTIIKDQVEGDPAPELAEKKFEPNVGGVPLAEYIAQERALNERGMSMLWGDSGEIDDKTLSVHGLDAYKGEIYNSDVDAFVAQNGGEVTATSLAQSKPTTPLFDRGKALKGPNPYDFETTLIEVGITGNPEEFDARYQKNIAGDGALKPARINDVGNEALAHFRDMQLQGEINKNLGILSDEAFNAMDEKAKLAYLNQLFTAVDAKDATNRLFYALNLARKYGTDTPTSTIDYVETEMDFEMKEAMVQHMLKEGWEDLQSEAFKLVAQQQWGSVPHAVLDIAFQELGPIQNVGLKTYFLGTMMDYLGIPQEGRPWNIGDRRQVIRSYIDEVGPQAVMNDLIAFRGWVEEQQKNNQLFRQFLVLEQYEAIFSDEFMATGNPIDTMDLWFGRFETAMEAVAAGWLLSRGAWKGVKAVFKGTDASVLNRTAKAAGARDAQTQLDKLVQGKMAEQVGVEPGEAALNLMPRPSVLADERTVKLPGVEKALDRGERIQNEILQTSRGNLSRLFTPDERAKIAQAQIDDLNLGETARVAPAMSTFEALEDGINIRAVITKNGEEAYHSFEELAYDMAMLDPAMDNLTILKRGENGKLVKVEIQGAEEIENILNTKNIKLWGDGELEERAFKANQAGREQEFLIYEREMARRRGEVTVNPLPDEFFLEYEHFRAYHPMDKVAFGEEGAGGFRGTVPQLRFLDSPQAKFVGDISEATAKAVRDEARLTNLFELMYTPYYKLGSKDKNIVANVFEWSESEAKALGRDPDLAEIIAQFPDMNQKQLEGLIAVRQGMDTQYTVLNRRLWREYNGQGYKSAVPNNADLPVIHGKVDDVQMDLKGGTFYDPIAGEMVTVTKAEMDALWASGARTMTAAEVIEVPGSRGTKKATRVLLRPEGYKVSKLSDDILERYPGYRYRFYQDPYYIVRKRNGVEVDGKVKNGTDEQAMRTSGSRLEAETYLNRGRFIKTVDENGKTVWSDKHGATYEVVPSKNIEASEASIREREVLQVEGRVLLDKRNQEALKDTSGQAAELMDFTKALEHGTSMLTRMGTHEDMLRTLKNALVNDYKLPELDGLAQNTKGIGEVLDDLKKGKANAATDPVMRQRYAEAESLARYIRQMEGIDDGFTTKFRAELIRLIGWVDRMGAKAGLKPGKIGYLERMAHTADPLGRMRKLNFLTFMIFRTGRQLLLQASQPLFLTGINPAYMMSGKWITDSIALNGAVMGLRRAGFDLPGMNWKTRAKIMGLSEAELKILARELDKSGVVDVVGAHSFKGGLNYDKAIRPHDGSVAGRARVAGQTTWRTTKGAAKRYGFDLGEKVNKVSTYNVAWRRLKKQKGYKSLREFTKEDWIKVAEDAENLSFAMNKAGAFRYQSGMFSLATQFMSFSHKLVLTAIGRNPALTGKETLRIWAGSFALYGANAFGGRDIARDMAVDMGVEELLDQPLVGDVSLLDVMSAGVLEQIINQVGSMTVDDWKDIDPTQIGPTFDVQEFLSMFLDGITRSPIGIGATFFGPFANRASSIMDVADLTRMTVTGLETESVTDRAMFIAEMAGRKIFPQFNDAVMAYYAYKYDKMVTSNGTVAQIELPGFNAVLRGVAGVRTLEEEMNWERKSVEWDFEEEKRNIITEGRRFVNQYIQLYREGDTSMETMREVFALVGEIAKQAPAGMQEEILQGIMVDKLGDDPEQTPIEQLAAAALEMRLTKEEIKKYLKHTAGTPEQKQQLDDWVDEMYDTKRMNREEMTEYMIQQNRR